MWPQSTTPDTLPFRDRIDAGKKLAASLEHFSNHPNTIIMALPRGGIPVAHEVAKKLHLPMNIFPVRKLGVPGHEELAMGALTIDGQYHINIDITSAFRISQKAIELVINRESKELSRRNQLYRHGMPMPLIKGDTVIIIDDGMATGATMRVTVQSLRHAGAGYIVVAIPVAPQDACDAIGQYVDELICLEKPPLFSSVGEWYQEFDQVSDAEVLSITALTRSQEP